MRTISTGLLCALVLAAPAIADRQRLTLRVSPPIALAPASLTVQTRIEPSDDNRVLNVTLESSTYHRSSEISLDGRNAKSVNVFQLRGIPAGTYEVRAVLLGLDGPLASTVQVARVESAPGSSR